MRSFYRGGAEISYFEKANAVAPIEGKVIFENIRLIKDKANNQIILSRNAKIKIVLDDEEKFSFNIPFGSKLFVQDNLFKYLRMEK